MMSTIVPGLKAAGRLELESFWQAQLDGGRPSDLNQMENFKEHALPL